MSQTASPVVVTIGTDRRWRVGCRVCTLLAVSGVSAWWLMLWHQDAAGLAWRALLPAATWLTATSIWPLTQARQWELRWDSSQWTFGAPNTLLSPVVVRVVIDLDRWLLLRIETTTGQQWLALSYSDHRPTWHSLRCALYCARPTAGARPEPTPGAP